MNRRLLALAILLVLIALGLYLKTEREPKARPSAEEHYVIDCSILDTKGVIVRRFNGKICVFLDDGRVISATQEGMRAYDQKNRLLWKNNVLLHHQMNLDLERKHLLLLSSEVLTVKGRPTRYDVLLKMDLNGNIVSRFAFAKHQTELNGIFGVPGFVYPVRVYWPPDVTQEYSHANSFYEIPDNEAAKRLPALTRGGFIVNATAPKQAMFVIDSSLKKILWSLRYEPWGGNQVHDVQVLPNGKFLLLANQIKTKGTTISALDEFDPIEQTVSWRYTATGTNRFFAEFAGGVQLLPSGEYLFNDRLGGGFVVKVDRDKNEVMRFPSPDIDPKTGRPHFFQQVKQADLRKFLSNNRGL